MTDSLPRYQQIKKIADAMHAQISKLGDLKLDDLRQQLRQRDSILVMSDSDMRTIPEEKVWQDQKDVRQLVMNGAAPACVCRRAADYHGNSGANAHE